MATQKHPTGLPVTLKDGRTAKINSWDPETNEYFVRPDTLAEGQTRIRSTKYTEAELDALIGAPKAPAASGFTPKDKWPTTRTKATLVLANGDQIEVMAFADDGGLAVDKHEHKVIGDGCILDDHEIRGVTFHSEVVTATVVKETPKPAPQAQTPAVVPQQKNEVMNPADLVDFQFVTGEAVDGPGFLDTPRLQLGQLVGKSVELGWKVGDIMFADMVLASAEGGDGRSPIGKRAGPIELAFLRGDSYWAEDIPFEVQKKQNLQAKIARTAAERAQVETAFGWKACVDYTFLVKKPDAFNDSLGLFTLPVGNAMWALALFSAREKSGSANAINAIQTAVKLYLKGRPYAGKFTLGSEVVKNDLNTFAATKFNRVGVWDEATVAGIVEILRGFQQK
jgi:hypothetical protein